MRRSCSRALVPTGPSGCLAVAGEGPDPRSWSSSHPEEEEEEAGGRSKSDLCVRGTPKHHVQTRLEMRRLGNDTSTATLWTKRFVAFYIRDIQFNERLLLRVQRANHDEGAGFGGFGRRRQLTLRISSPDAERDESVQKSELYRHQHPSPSVAVNAPTGPPRLEPDVPGGQVRHDALTPATACPAPTTTRPAWRRWLSCRTRPPSLGAHGLVAHRRAKPGPLAHLVLGRGEGVDLLELFYGLRVLSLRLERLAQEERLGGGLGVGVRLGVQDG